MIDVNLLRSTRLYKNACGRQKQKCQHLKLRDFETCRLKLLQFLKRLASNCYQGSRLRLEKKVFEWDPRQTDSIFLNMIMDKVLRLVLVFVCLWTLAAAQSWYRSLLLSRREYARLILVSEKLISVLEILFTSM